MENDQPEEDPTTKEVSEEEGARALGLLPASPTLPGVIQPPLPPPNLTGPPPLPPGRPPSSPAKKFNFPCKDYSRKSCERPDCKFKHIESKEINFCHDFQNKGCTREVCKFLHCTIEEESIFHKTKKLPDKVLKHYFQNHNPLCKEFTEGECKNGISCSYYHPQAEGECRSASCFPSMSTPPPPIRQRPPQPHPSSWQTYRPTQPNNYSLPPPIENLNYAAIPPPLPPTLPPGSHIAAAIQAHPPPPPPALGAVPTTSEIYKSELQEDQSDFPVAKKARLGSSQCFKNCTVCPKLGHRLDSVEQKLKSLNHATTQIMQRIASSSSELMQTLNTPENRNVTQIQESASPISFMNVGLNTQTPQLNRTQDLNNTGLNFNSLINNILQNASFMQQQNRNNPQQSLMNAGRPLMNSPAQQLLCASTDRPLLNATQQKIAPNSNLQYSMAVSNPQQLGNNSQDMISNQLLNSRQMLNPTGQTHGQQQLVRTNAQVNTNPDMLNMGAEIPPYMHVNERQQMMGSGNADRQMQPDHQLIHNTGKQQILTGGPGQLLTGNSSQQMIASNAGPQYINANSGQQMIGGNTGQMMAVSTNQMLGSAQQIMASASMLGNNNNNPNQQICSNQQNTNSNQQLFNNQQIYADCSAHLAQQSLPQQNSQLAISTQAQLAHQMSQPLCNATQGLAPGNNNQHQQPNVSFSMMSQGMLH